MSGPTISRHRYLKMSDRHRPLWAALRAFIYANAVSSLVEAGCGVGELSYAVESYTGIDTNQQVLNQNRTYYGGDARWINKDWREVDVRELQADMFLSTALIEHCESYEPFLQRVCGIPDLKFAVVTFHKGLRDTGTTLRQHDDLFFDNYYCEEHVKSWLSEHLKDVAWQIYTLPHSWSRRWRKHRWDSVLVIDWTSNANMGMWEREWR